jgi:hypothetical protein
VKPVASERVRFDPGPHIYTLETGRQVPSVTQILRGAGMLRDHARTDPWYAERGTAVHEAIRLHLGGELDRESLDERIVPHFDAAANVVDTLGLVPIFAECPLTTGTFAGTVDLIAHSRVYGGLVVLDWKTGGFEPGHQIQVAGGYMELLIDNAGDGALIPVSGAEVWTARSVIVELKDDATFTIRTFGVTESTLARSRFREALNIYLWKEQNGVNA